MSPRGFKLLTSVGKLIKRLPQPLRAPKRRPQSHALSLTPSHLDMVPFDIIEEILLYLPGQDIVRMKQVQ